MFSQTKETIKDWRMYLVEVESPIYLIPLITGLFMIFPLVVLGSVIVDIIEKLMNIIKM